MLRYRWSTPARRQNALIGTLRSKAAHYPRTIFGIAQDVTEAKQRENDLYFSCHRMAEFK